MPLIDTHIHLDEEAFSTDRADVIRRAGEAGLTAVVAPGITLASSRECVKLAAEFPMVYAAVGIHPNYASQAAPDDWSEIVPLAQQPKVVAIGETGLDKYWDFCPFDVQIDYFQRHLELAAETGLPFIVHCRDCEPEVIHELRNAAGQGTLNGVMHSFCGSRETAEIALELGLYISYSGMLTYKKNTDIRELARSIPRDRLMVETDAPYLSPDPLRGKRNEPANVQHIARRLAEVLEITPEELGELTTNNARRFFGLDELESD